MDALTVKCPTCSQPKNVECIRLVTGPAYKIAWARTDPHPAREAKCRG